jgi:hypothetical protein
MNIVETVEMHQQKVWKRSGKRQGKVWKRKLMLGYWRINSFMNVGIINNLSKIHSSYFAHFSVVKNDTTCMKDANSIISNRILFC